MVIKRGRLSPKKQNGAFPFQEKRRSGIRPQLVSISRG
jgi:hypothetical protein